MCFMPLMIELYPNHPSSRLGRSESYRKREFFAFTSQSEQNEYKLVFEGVHNRYTGSYSHYKLALLPRCRAVRVTKDSEKLL